MPRLLESLTIEGPAGPLETLHEGPDDGTEVVRVAVVCHPHPLHGGTMHNKVVFRLARGARKAGCAVVRFNFRGVGSSAGTHDDGRGEQDDVRAALAYARGRYPDLPVSVGGFSFGSSMSACVVIWESMRRTFGRLPTGKTRSAKLVAAITWPRVGSLSSRKSRP